MLRLYYVRPIKYTFRLDYRHVICYVAKLTAEPEDNVQRLLYKYLVKTKIYNKIYRQRTRN